MHSEVCIVPVHADYIQRQYFIYYIVNWRQAHVECRIGRVVSEARHSRHWGRVSFIYALLHAYWARVATATRLMPSKANHLIKVLFAVSSAAHPPPSTSQTFSLLSPRQARSSLRHASHTVVPVPDSYPIDEPAASHTPRSSVRSANRRGRSFTSLVWIYIPVLDILPIKSFRHYASP